MFTETTFVEFVRFQFNFNFSCQVHTVSNVKLKLLMKLWIVTSTAAVAMSGRLKGCYPSILHSINVG